MDFEDIKAQLGMLFTRMENEPEDAHEIYEQIHERLNELRALNLPLPDDLVEFERQLERDFAHLDRSRRGGTKRD